MLSRQPLEHVVSVRREADGERTDFTLLPDAVEDDDTASAPARDEARERVHQLSTVGEVSCVEEVVAVEEVQGRISHTHILPMSSGRAARRGQPSSSPLRWRTLAPRLVEEQGGGDGDVERANLPCERNRDDAVACAADKRANPLFLGSEHESDSSRQVGVPHGSRSFGVGGIGPQALPLDVGEVARKVGDHRDRQVLHCACRRSANHGGDTH